MFVQRLGNKVSAGASASFKKNVGRLGQRKVEIRGISQQSVVAAVWIIAGAAAGLKEKSIHESMAASKADYPLGCFVAGAFCGVGGGLWLNQDGTFSSLVSPYNSVKNVPESIPPK